MILHITFTFVAIKLSIIISQSMCTCDILDIVYQITVISLFRNVIHIIIG